MISPKKSFLLFSTIFLLFAAILSAAPQYMQAKVFFKTKAQWAELCTMGLDRIGKGIDYVEIVTNPDELKMIESHGYRTEIVHEDLTKFYQSRLTAGKDMGGYRTLSEIEAHIDSLIAAHPDIVSNKVSIGQTIEGRNQWAFKISDNPNVDEDEPEVLYTAAIHCREVITPEVLIYFANYLVDNYASMPDVKSIVDNRELWFILIVNPDGYYYNEMTDPDGGGMWRKNRRHNGDGSYGVDINRNFGYEWGYDNDGSSPTPGAEDYRGIGPFSEPETQNLRNFHLAHHFVISIYYHSSSNLVLWPWGYADLFTPDQDIFFQMGDSMTAENGYNPGTPWQVIYNVNGSTDDWIYAEQTLKDKTFAMSAEVGTNLDGFWPPLSRIPALVSENLGPNLFLARIASSIYTLRAPVAPALSAPDTVDVPDYQIHWTHADTLNPAVAFELVELQDYQRITDSANSLSNYVNNGFSVSTTRSHSSPSSFCSGEGDNLNRSFQQDYPFPIQSGDSLFFWTYYIIESGWDYAYVEVSANGGDFAPIPGNITTNANPHGQNRGNGITGSSGSWVKGKFNLSQFAGQVISIRFSYLTDGYTAYEGIYFDDLYPINIFATENHYSLPSTDSSYSFTGKLEGLYFYKVRAEDAQNQWSAYSGLKSTLVKFPPSYICGDATGDKTVNVSDAVFIINYVFVPGAPVPNPYASGDVNCDAVVNVSDAVYIINYVFVTGSPLPCECK